MKLNFKIFYKIDIINFTIINESDRKTKNY